VLEGGAMRGIFTAGVLDAFVDHGEPAFDLVVGVSAGACCAASYLSGQTGRNRRIFVEQMTTRAFVDPARMARGGSITDMGFIMGPVTFELDPLDVDAMRRSTTRLEIVAADAVTGEARYLEGQGADCVDALHASVAMPFFYRGGPVRFRGGLYFDGGVADPVPVGRALEAGSTDVTVVLTRPLSWVPAPVSLAETILLTVDPTMQRFPGTYHAVRARHLAYERARALVSSPPAGVALRLFAPPPGFPVKRWTRQKDALEAGYEMGRSAVTPRPSRPRPRREGTRARPGSWR
jgi:predicted patatin/cPLA2 family phospholipase